MKAIALVYRKVEDRDANQGCDIDQEFETIGEAKKYAKRALTEEYLRHIESTGPRFEYSQVVVNGECLYEYFGK